MARSNPTRQNPIRGNPTRANPRRKTSDDKEQYERFREFAREVQADDEPEAFDQTFRKLVPLRRRQSD